MQVDPGFSQLNPTLAFRDFQLLKLKYDMLLSNFAFNCNLRHSTEAPTNNVATPDTIASRCGSASVKGTVRKENQDRFAAYVSDVQSNPPPCHHSR